MASGNGVPTMEMTKWFDNNYHSAVVRDETQIHTHMCYCEFNDIIQSIADLDADLIPIESSRSRMEKLRHQALEHLSPPQLWIDPDCGLKTRGWTEVEKPLANMVAAAKNMRREMNGKRIERGI